MVGVNNAEGVSVAGCVMNISNREVGVGASSDVDVCVGRFCTNTSVGEI